MSSATARPSDASPTRIIRSKQDSLMVRTKRCAYGFGERFVGSVRAECLARLVPRGEGYLRTAVRAFVDHYHEERPHQGLNNELIAPKTTLVGPGRVRCRERLGGVLKF